MMYIRKLADGTMRKVTQVRERDGSLVNKDGSIIMRVSLAEYRTLRETLAEYRTLRETLAEYRTLLET